ncbi:MAG: hypothetical protein ACRDIA_02355, partial [Actinomycetota bacterium]
MVKNSRLFVATLGAIAGIVSVAILSSAMAWACTPSAAITLSPQGGPAGSAVKVRGQFPSDASVEIRWNSPDGDLLQMTAGPEFSEDVRIPDVPPDTYVVMAIQPATSTRARATFTVTQGSAVGGDHSERDAIMYEGQAPGPRETSSGEAASAVPETSGAKA